MVLTANIVTDKLLSQFNKEGYKQLMIDDIMYHILSDNDIPGIEWGFIS